VIESTGFHQAEALSVLKPSDAAQDEDHRGVVARLDVWIAGLDATDRQRHLADLVDALATFEHSSPDAGVYKSPGIR
jgi:hypothetical protein